MARRVKHTVRLTEEEQVQLRRAAKERGYLNPTTFIRAAIRNAVAGREVELTSAEQRIASTLERLSSGLFRANRVLFAVLDTLVKCFLTFVPEPPAMPWVRLLLGREIATTDLSILLAKGWRDSQGAMHDLVNRAE